MGGKFLVDIMSRNLSIKLMTVIVFIGSVLTTVFSQQPIFDEIKLSIQANKNTQGYPLKKEDIKLYIDGKKTEVAEVLKDNSPLSIVFVVITNPWGCIDSIVPFASQTQFDRTFVNTDDVAIVVSDRQREIIREFGKDNALISKDFTEAAKQARANSYEHYNSEDQGMRVEAGIVYPLAALRSAVDLLSETSFETDRHIIFISDLENAKIGSSENAKAIFSELIDKRITVSWLLNDVPKRMQTASRIPYGKRDFFLALPSLTGGYFQKCDQGTSLFSILSGRDGQGYTTFEDGIESIMEGIRQRSIIKYIRQNKANNGSQVKIDLSDTFQNDRQLFYNYPKLIK